MARFSEWTIQQARERIPQIDEGHKANLRFIAGEHWQGGDGWIGPMLEKTEAGFAQALAKVQRSFIARNVIGEIIDNHLAGVLGRSPHFTVALRRPLEKGEEPTEAEAQLIAEATALLTEWWDANQAVARRHSDVRQSAGQIRLCSVHDLLQDAGKSLLATTRGLLRIVIDPDVIEQGEDGVSTIPAFDDFSAALGRLYVAHPTSEQATVYVDRGLNAVGAYIYHEEAEDGSQNGTSRERAELCFLDEQGNTIIRLVGEGAGQQTAPLQLGGRLTMHEMERPLYLTEPLRKMQMAINLALTLGSRNLVSGGFLERLFLNTSKPGDWAWDEEKQRFVHQPVDTIRLGEGTTNFLYGLPTYDERGNVTGYTNPTVMFRDPVSSDTFIQMERAIYRGILEEARQLHTLIAGDAAVSGESRIQAKDTFRNSLLLTKPQLDAALRWLLETLLAMAADLAGRPGYFEELRVNADAQISLGIASGDEVRSNIEAYQQGLLSRPAAMRRLGVDDVNAMAEAVDSDAANLLMWLKEKASIYQILAAKGTLNESAILRVVGMSDETVRKLTELVQEKSVNG